jgi:hypothetical protein
MGFFLILISSFIGILTFEHFIFYLNLQAPKKWRSKVLIFHKHYFFILDTFFLYTKQFLAPEISFAFYKSEPLCNNWILLELLIPHKMV